MDKSQKQSVLLVEDNAVLLNLMALVLKLDGYSVVAFESAERALANLRSTSNGFDGLVTDYHLPGMNGTELARHVSELQDNIKVLIVSSDEDCRTWLRGTDSYLQKPFTNGGLLIAVAELLKSPAPSGERRENSPDRKRRIKPE
jgi:DNA-binding NtrC family response regulator